MVAGASGRVGRCKAAATETLSLTRYTSRSPRRRQPGKAGQRTTPPVWICLGSPLAGDGSAAPDLTRIYVGGKHPIRRNHRLPFIANGGRKADITCETA